ncbi:23S rRNA (adenine(2503)-C(2))-methyltransferase RlmN [Bacilli bacterium]|nr:23S rRNA (adenine(2503)-C(2))-methyltransferase RlmN [Bacilli bacterium]
MTNISKNSITILKENFVFNKLINIKTLIDDSDETTKFLFELTDGQRIETVLMKFNYGYSVCVSTQVGCNMGCKFCASGQLKKIRNLNVDEFVLQIIEVNKYLKNLNGKSISNIVIMGIGEPFDNYENLSSALKIFTNHFGINIGSRHITVSTCGLVPYIKKFGVDFPQVNLAISLHATNDKTRNSLMPINNKYNLKTLFDALHEYSDNCNRKITFEYLLLKDVNDSYENAIELTKLLKGLICYVNIIKYNSVSENNFVKSNNIGDFAKVLIAHGINTTTRLERGSKIDAACGQLRAKNEKK